MKWTEKQITKQILKGVLGAGASRFGIGVVNELVTETASVPLTIEFAGFATKKILPATAKIGLSVFGSIIADMAFPDPCY